MTDGNDRQLSLPGLGGGQQDTSLPLYVAEKWGFALAYIETDAGSIFYAVQDWIAGLTSSDARKSSDMWRKLKNQLRISIPQFPYTASNGRVYQMDFTDDEGLYLIAQELRVTATRPALKSIKDFLAQAGVFVDEARRNPDRLLDAGLDMYDRMGKSEVWKQARIEGKIARREFTDALVRAVLEADASLFRKATGTLYKSLWNRTAQQLRDDLGIGKRASIRDNMSAIALIYTRLTEAICADMLDSAVEFISEDRALEVVQTVAEAIHKQAAETEKLLGRDLVTGQKLLDG